MCHNFSIFTKEKINDFVMNLKPEKYKIEVRLINQKVDKKIIDKVVKELYRTSIPLTTFW